MGDEDTSTTFNGTGLPVKVRSGRDAGIEGPRTCFNQIYHALHKELRQSCGRLPGGRDPTLSLLMGTWPHQIDRFDRQYDKAFAKDPLFGRF